MALPENAKEIYQFLLAHGLSSNAAAGIAGNIQRESGGNPESVGTGGNGLIGWTPPLAGAVTGNPQKDLQFQLQHVMIYINQNGSVADINAHSGSPTEAATYFSNRYERPGIPALSQRIQAAIDVATSAKTGNWGTSAGTNSGGAAPGGGGIFSWPSQITGFFADGTKFVHGLLWILTPSNWVRIGAFFAGIILLMVAIYALISVAEGGPALPKLMPVPV